MNALSAVAKIYAREARRTVQTVYSLFQRREFRKSIGLPDQNPLFLPHDVPWEAIVDKVRLTKPQMADIIKTRLEEKGIGLTVLVPVREAILDEQNVWEILKRRSLREELGLPLLDEKYPQHALGDISVFVRVSVSQYEAEALKKALDEPPALATSNPEDRGIALGLELSGEGAQSAKRWAEATAQEAKKNFVDPRDRKSRDVVFVAAVSRTLPFNGQVQMIDFLWKVERHLNAERGRFVGRVIARLHEDEQDPLRSELLKILMGRFAPYPAGKIITAAVKGFGRRYRNNLRPRVELVVSLGLEMYRDDPEKLRCYLEAAEKSNSLRKSSLVRQIMDEGNG